MDGVECGCALDDTHKHYRAALSEALLDCTGM